MDNSVAPNTTTPDAEITKAALEDLDQKAEARLA